MGNDIKTSVVVDLEGNLERQTKRLEASIKRFSRNGSRDLKKLNRSAKGVGGSFASMGKRYLGAAAAGAIAMKTGKKLLGLEERYERLGVQANISPKKAIALRQRVFNTAQASDVRVDAAEILSAIEAIVEKTGDLKFAEKNIRNIALAIKATSSAGKDIGNIAAEFQKMGITDPTEVLKALDLLTVQGKAGAFTLQNLAGLGSRTVTAYTASGRGGPDAIREMGAVLQVIRQGTGSSEMAATAFEAVLRTLGDAKKVKSLKKGGIQVFDPESLKQGKEVLRPLNELMKDIVKATGGKKTLLSKVFDAEAIRAFNAMSSEYQRTGGFTSLDKFMQVQAGGDAITADSARLARTGNSRITAAGTFLTDRTDTAINKIIGEDASVSGFGKFWVESVSKDIRTLFGSEQPNTKVELKIDSDKPVTVKSIKSQNLDVTVDSGVGMSGN